jgi:hypothetical protein
MMILMPQYFSGLVYYGRGSSGSIVSDYGLDVRAIEVRSPTGGEDFSSSPCVQTGSGANPASYPMVTGSSFPGGKARPGRDAYHSPPSSAEVKNELKLYLLSPHVPPWRVAGQLYFFTFFTGLLRLTSYLFFNTTMQNGSKFHWRDLQPLVMAEVSYIPHKVDNGWNNFGSESVL